MKAKTRGQETLVGTEGSMRSPPTSYSPLPFPRIVLYVWLGRKRFLAF